MYVCICNSVTDKDIRQAAESGVHTMRQLRVETGCAGTCGQCAELASELLADARRQLPSERELPIPVLPAFA